MRAEKLHKEELHADKKPEVEINVDDEYDSDRYEDEVAPALPRLNDDEGRWMRYDAEDYWDDDIIIVGSGSGAVASGSGAGPAAQVSSSEVKKDEDCASFEKPPGASGLSIARPLFPEAH
jgi:hypothetical protein